MGLLALDAATATGGPPACRRGWPLHAAAIAGQGGRRSAFSMHSGGGAGEVVLRRPGTMWLTAFQSWPLSPSVPSSCYNRVDYGLITDFPRQAPSVIGTDVIRVTFPAGDTGPVTILIQNPQARFQRPRCDRSCRHVDQAAHGSKGPLANCGHPQRGQPTRNDSEGRTDPGVRPPRTRNRGSGPNFANEPCSTMWGKGRPGRR